MKRASGLAALFASAFVWAGTAALGQNPPPPPPSESTLLEVLRSDAPLQRKADTCRQLGMVGTRAAVPALAGLLNDDSLEHWARYALEQIPDPAAAQAIRDAVPKLKGRHLAGALMSVGVCSSKDPSHPLDGDAPMLARFLRDQDGDVASAAAYALAKIGTVKASKAIEQALPHASVSMKPVLWDAALRCAGTLSRNGPDRDAAGIYDRLLASDAPVYVRVGAARGSVLARKSGSSVPLLIRLLQDRDDAMFRVALELTHEVAGPAATGAVATALPKLPIDRQRLVIDALGSRGDRAALPAIRSAAGRTETSIRVAAVGALARLGDTASLPILLEAATSSDAAVAAAGSNALVTLRGSAVDDALIRLAGGQDSARAQVAIDCLARRQSAAAAPALIKVAREGNGSVRLAALNALGELASAGDIPALLDVLVDAKDGPNLEAAEQALAKVCGKAADPAATAEKVAGRLDQAHPAATAALLRVLAGLGGSRALQAIRAAAQGGSGEVKETAVRALCNWTTPEAAPDLIALARNADNPSHRLLALRGYIRLANDESLPAQRRLTMCAEVRSMLGRDDEKRLWLGALSSIPSPGALELISPLISDSGVGEEACAAAVAVVARLLRAPDASQPQLKAHLPAIAEALEKARLRTGNAQLQNAIRELQARVKAMQDRA